MKRGIDPSRIESIEGDTIKHKKHSAKTYVFRVELNQEEDGRWSATWAHIREDALRNIREAVEAYVEDLLRSGEPLSKNTSVINAPAVSVTV